MNLKNKNLNFIKKKKKEKKRKEKQPQSPSSECPKHKLWGMKLHINNLKENGPEKEQQKENGLSSNMI